MLLYFTPVVEPEVVVVAFAVGVGYSFPQHCSIERHTASISCESRADTYTKIVIEEVVYSNVCSHAPRTGSVCVEEVGGLGFVSERGIASSDAEVECHSFLFWCG